MNRLPILADEHVKRSYIHALRQSGFEVDAVAATGAGERDRRHLEASAEKGLVILTNDDDFVRLATQHTHAGIIFYSTQNHNPTDFVAAVRRIDRYFSPAEIHNHVEWLENWL